MSAYAAALSRATNLLVTIASKAGSYQSTESNLPAMTGLGWERIESEEGGQPMLKIIWKRDRSGGETFENVYDTDSGTIRVNSVVEPLWPPGSSSTHGQLALPPCHWRSEITAMDWMRCTGTNRRLNKSIRSVELFGITNRDTITVINIVIPNFNQAGIHPGQIFFPTDGDHFKALLGTPDAMAIFFMLALHRRQLGRKAIESIRVFWRPLTSAASPSQTDSYCMILSVADAPKREDDTSSEDASSSQDVSSDEIEMG
ncbi:uncharacterized protein RCC_05500 [Ramularia collo-cygni]|uniref:Uncharacterized protein n=1 Tax=Ramularia collo-cygni TaxID=112498 RepID=A0A2D3VD99_9PEZI|nr:uncharacterized protein RCC_05500 [Ramularia collo-cygni]CZT19649.1 uncharacterized protein RCC_05500 [Ramularia collo-cygni]